MSCAIFIICQVHSAKEMSLLKVVIVSVLVAVVAVVIGGVYWQFYHEVPQVPEVEWWSNEPQGNDQITINKMNDIYYSDEVLQALKSRLQTTRYFETMKDSNWQYGANMNELKVLIDYWKEQYDWRKHEAILNKFNHFHAKIKGLNIHFVHEKPETTPDVKILPILLLHGWPGTFYEFHKVIPLLTQVKDGFAFEVICPSLPGYVFSEAAQKPGMEPQQIAHVFIALMKALGFNSYYIQGGDWGSAIARAIAVLDESHVRGIHVNLFYTLPKYGPLSFLNTWLFPSNIGSKKQIERFLPLTELFARFHTESGYFHMHETKPDSIGLAMNDSPAGLAQYLLEKYFSWSGCKTNDSLSCLEDKIPREELITTIMLYWLTECMPTSIRVYKELDSNNKIFKSPVKVPSAVAQFPDDAFIAPQAWLPHTYHDMVQYTEMPRGGHFAALEEPELLAEDLWKFLKKVEHI